MESFFNTHDYLVDHLDASLRRRLMDEIDWSSRMIGIKGARGVGKTTFLLQYAKERFGHDRSCLYINMNNLYFQERGIAEFAGDFCKIGGKVLLIDQVFKHSDWSSELRKCYEQYPNLKIVFTGSSVMRLKEENPDLNGIVSSYQLRGLSFREFLKVKAGVDIEPIKLDNILSDHVEIAEEILKKVNPNDYFKDYLHYGYYPFFMEKKNFSENLLKTMNMMMEVDILLIQQIDLKYLPKIKKLFYKMALEGTLSPNVSQLATDNDTSRATIMNYIKYLSDARLINIIFNKGESFPKKPARILMHNTNLIYTIYPPRSDRQDVLDTFFVNALWKGHVLHNGNKNSTFLVDGHLDFKVAYGDERYKINGDKIYCAADSLDVGAGKIIPIWMFGLLY